MFDSSDSEEDTNVVPAQTLKIDCCMGGLGRACVIASCLLQYFDNSVTPDQTIFLLRDLRGACAVQTVKQYNFIQDFRSLCERWMDEDIDRSVSR